MSLALQIVETVSERAAGARVRVVRIDVGALAAVLPDALEFCFELACEGTPAQGASLEIRVVEGKARCRACHDTFALAGPIGRCPCGGTDVERLAGEELRIREMEVI